MGDAWWRRGEGGWREGSGRQCRSGRGSAQGALIKEAFPLDLLFAGGGRTGGGCFLVFLFCLHDKRGAHNEDGGDGDDDDNGGSFPPIFLKPLANRSGRFALSARHAQCAGTGGGGGTERFGRRRGGSLKLIYKVASATSSHVYS